MNEMKSKVSHAYTLFAWLGCTVLSVYVEYFIVLLQIVY